MGDGRVAHGLAGGRLVLASHNAGKVKEISELLAPYAVSTVSAGLLGLAEPEERGKSFAENAALKALAAAQVSGLVALADDSGLCVEALDGAPGIYSARWAGPDKDFAVAMKRLNHELEKMDERKTTSRRAHFVCALALAWPNGAIEIFEGRVDGRLVWPPRGTRGFGYDPLFVPDGEKETFGEMDPARKHAMSHRARAFALMKAQLLDAKPNHE
jgi:XTP/dITP diphosphohydrolase